VAAEFGKAFVVSYSFSKGSDEMNRILFSLAIVGMFSLMMLTSSARADSPCCDPCCTPCCTQVCCKTTYKTVVSYCPVTIYKCERYVDACGCCRTRRVPCTTYKKVCRRVPVTTCTQVAKPCCFPSPAACCCPAPACVQAPTCCPPTVACCPEPAPRPRLVDRLRARRVRL
jgi:hypothetical protein